MSDRSDLTYDPSRAFGVSVYRTEERLFAEGERIQFTLTYHPEKIANRELGTIAAINVNGDLKLQMDSKRPRMAVWTRLTAEGHS